MNYIQYMQTPSAPILSTDGIKVEVKEPVQPIVHPLSQTKGYLAWAANKTNPNVEDYEKFLQQQSKERPIISQGREMTEDEKRASQQKLELNGQLQKEEADRQKAAEVVVEGLNYVSPSYWANKYGADFNGAESFLFDIAADPTTYLSMGVLPLAKQVGKKATKEVVEKAAKETAEKTIKEGVEKSGKRGIGRDIEKEFIFHVYDNNLFGLPYKDDIVTYSRATDKANALDRLYDGRYAVNAEESFARRNNTGASRVEFMRQHPTASVVGPGMSPTTTVEEEIHRASRDFASKHADEFSQALDDKVLYDQLLEAGEYGYSEGVILGRRGNGKVRIAASKDANSPFDRITLNHEAAGHATGNFNDGYIYNYLKENNIIDWDGVSPYFKDADRGEIGQHLAELADWLGFKSDAAGNYTRPFGKSTITKTDVLRFRDAMIEKGINMRNSIFGNIKDMDKFVQFLNQHRFVLASPIVAGATIPMVTNQQEPPQMQKHGGQLNYINYSK